MDGRTDAPALRCLFLSMVSMTNGALSARGCTRLYGLKCEQASVGDRDALCRRIFKPCKVISAGHQAHPVLDLVLDMPTEHVLVSLVFEKSCSGRSFLFLIYES